MRTDLGIATTEATYQILDRARESKLIAKGSKLLGSVQDAVG